MSNRTVVPWWRPQLGEREFELVADVLRSDYLNDGKVTREFEAEIARRFGAKHAVAATSGTMGLFLALAALGIGKGDEVIVPDMTFIATANAVSLTGATCVLVDVDPETLALSPDALDKAITKRTKAIVPVHVSGRAGTIREVLAVAARHGVPVVEDAAEALPSPVRGRCLGTLGIAGMLSFSPNKIMTTGQGGVVLTDSDDVHQKLRALKDQGRAVQGTGGDDLHDSLGYNFKFTNVQAAIGLAQLDHMDERLARQRRTYDLYREGLGSVNGIRTFAVDAEGGEVPLWVDAIAERRDELCARLDSEGFPTRKFWHPIHTQTPYKDADERFPVSTALSPQAVWLPSAFQLRDEDIAVVIRLIRSFYGA
jgi:perosamine synthetase